MKIQLKRSNVLDGGKAKEPTPTQMEYGEIAVNYNNTDPALFIKDSSDAIVKVSLDLLSTGLQPGDNVSELNNDAGYITAGEVPTAPVDSVNSKTGVVVLTASDVGAATTAQGAKADSALQSGDNISELNNNAGYITAGDVPSAPVNSVNAKTGTVVLNAADVGAATTAQGAKADSALQPGDDVSDLNNDAGYLTPGDDISELNNNAGYITVDDIPAAGVESVNSMTGVVVLTYSDVSAMPLDISVLTELS